MSCFSSCHCNKDSIKCFRKMLYWRYKKLIETSLEVYWLVYRVWLDYILQDKSDHLRHRWIARSSSSISISVSPWRWCDKLKSSTCLCPWTRRVYAATSKWARSALRVSTAHQLQSSQERTEVRDRKTENKQSVKGQEKASAGRKCCGVTRSARDCWWRSLSSRRL